MPFVTIATEISAKECRPISDVLFFVQNFLYRKIQVTVRWKGVGGRYLSISSGKEFSCIIPHFLLKFLNLANHQEVGSNICISSENLKIIKSGHERSRHWIWRKSWTIFNNTYVTLYEWCDGTERIGDTKLYTEDVCTSSNVAFRSQSRI